MTAATSYSTIAARLHELRLTSGNPSYTELVRRVAAVRARRGVPDAQQRPARATVYDCFKPDRRRFDIELVTDIAAALGLEGDELDDFVQRCWSVQHGLDASRIVHVRTTLPDPSHGFVGRAVELAVLEGDAPVVVVAGLAGTGKTSLVVDAARRRLAAGRASTVVVADLRGFAPDQPAADPDSVMDAVVRSLGGDHLRLRAGRERRRAYTDLLVERRALLVLDDAADAEQVEPLLPADGSVAAWVTSRNAIAGPLDAVALDLDVLPAADGAELLRVAAGDAVATWTTDELVELGEAVGLLPLALDVLASRIVARPGWTPADHVRSLVGGHGGTRLDGAVRAVLDASYEQLPDDAARLLRMMAAVPFEELGTPSVAAMADGDGEAVAVAVGRLVDAHLVSRPAPDRYRMHALVRAHARDRSLDADRPSDRDRALQAVVEHFVATCRGAAEAASTRALPPARHPVPTSVPELGAEQAIAWVDAEFENLLAAAGEEGAAVRPTVAVELAESLDWYVERRYRYQDALILYDRARTAARALGDDAGEGFAELGRAQAFTRLADLDRAINSVRRAEVLLAGDERGLARAKTVLAVWAFQASDWDTATAALQEAIALAERAGNRSDLGRCHGNLAVVHARTGRLDLAVEHQARAAALAMEVGDVDTAAFTWMNSSGTQLLRGDHEAALAAARQAVELSEAHGVREVLPLARNNLGSALVELGRVDDGIAEIERAGDEARAIGDKLAELDVEINLGAAHLAAGRLDDADPHLAAAHDLAVAAGDEFHRARALEFAGRVSIERGDTEAARTQLTTALGLYGADLPESRRTRELLDGLPADAARPT